MESNTSLHYRESHEIESIHKIYPCFSSPAALASKVSSASFCNNSFCTICCSSSSTTDSFYVDKHKEVQERTEQNKQPSNPQDELHNQPHIIQPHAIKPNVTQNSKQMNVSSPMSQDNQEKIQPVKTSTFSNHFLSPSNQINANTPNTYPTSLYPHPVCPQPHSRSHSHSLSHPHPSQMYGYPPFPFLFPPTPLSPPPLHPPPPCVYSPLHRHNGHNGHNGHNRYGYPLPLMPLPHLHPPFSLPSMLPLGSSPYAVPPSTYVSPFYDPTIQFTHSSNPSAHSIPIQPRPLNTPKEEETNLASYTFTNESTIVTQAKQSVEKTSISSSVDPPVPPSPCSPPTQESNPSKKRKVYSDSKQKKSPTLDSMTALALPSSAATVSATTTTTDTASLPSLASLVSLESNQKDSEPLKEQKDHSRSNDRNSKSHKKQNSQTIYKKRNRYFVFTEPEQVEELANTYSVQLAHYDCTKPIPMCRYLYQKDQKRCTKTKIYTNGLCSDHYRFIISKTFVPSSTSTSTLTSTSSKKKHSSHSHSRSSIYRLHYKKKTL